ncbi:MAG: low specificity L-threonine aldolase [Verrucomicrobia bacterium]|nr:low specificity L-threonine aldolase [Verrucomicrobiota bacterium]
MERVGEHHEFASDNTLGICPEALAALEEANRGGAESYGDDEWTRRLRQLVCDLFETDCDTHLVFNGTAANALALAQLCEPFHSVVCYQQAHIQTDECGAPEFFTHGSKLLLVGGDSGKINVEEAKEMIDRQPELHAHKPRVISITQATEFGTVYRGDEIDAIADLARSREMFLHMDGARFANAVATLDCAPKEMTWQRGVDVLGFGGTKNGLAAGELVIFFKKELSREFDYRLKQAGQLASKMRFLAAPWIKLLDGGVWLRNAQHANDKARKFADRLAREIKIDIVLPVEANAVFFRLPEVIVRNLEARGWHFYNFVEPGVYRLMCSWATTDVEIERFIGDVLRSAKESV